MMTSIFMPFDLSPKSLPMSNYIFMLMFLPPILFNQPLLMQPSSMWFPKYSLSMLSFSLSSSSKTKFSPSAMLVLHSSFFILCTLNILGLTPFTPPTTSHLTVTLSIGMSMWLSLILLMLLITPSKTMYSQIPSNSPFEISPFLAIVELTSNLIRPLTLSFRLAANISAGHIILSMMSSSLSIMSLSLTMLLSPTILLGIGYLSFDLAIAMIQAFVLTLLTFMYSNDYLP